MLLDIVQLAENAEDGKAGGVGMKTDREAKVEVTKDKNRREATFELIKCKIGLR